MSAAQNKAIAQNIFAALNERNLASVVSYYAPDCRFHGWDSETLDVAGYQAAMSALVAGFPNSRFPIDDIIAEGEQVVVRHSMQGTHNAEFQGIPATGRAVRVDAIVIFRFENGAPVELWLNADFLGLMQQLGVVPAPAQAS